LGIRMYNVYPPFSPPFSSRNRKKISAAVRQTAAHTPPRAPPGQHVAGVVRPCVHTPEADQQRERHDEQPDPRPGSPGTAPTFEGTEAEEVPDGRPDGDHRHGVGAWEAVTGLVYELQGGRWPWPLEEDLEEPGQSSRAKSRRQEDDSREAHLEVIPPASQQQEGEAGEDCHREENFGREDGLEHVHARGEVGLAARVEEAQHREIRPHQRVPGYDVLHHAAEGPGEETRENEPEGEGEAVDPTGGEPPPQPDSPEKRRRGGPRSARSPL